MPRGQLSTIVWVSIAALGVALLAFFQPVDATGSDAAVSLVAAQAVLEHGTLELSVYRDDPRLIYDLDADYRIFKQGETRYYFSVGAPLLSVPAVWLANRFGWHMLEPQAESALQNLLSAVACGVVLLLLYALARTYLPPSQSLGLALVFQLGSPLISTLATALWNLDFSIPLLLIVLIVLARYERDGANRRQLLAGGVIILVCSTLAVMSRSASALLLPPLGLYGLECAGLSRRRVLAVAFVGVAGLIVMDQMPYYLFETYYAPQRLFGSFDPRDGVPNVLLTPSRGLLVFCPFLIPLIAALWIYRRQVFAHRLVWLCSAWIVFEVVAVGTKAIWWGGHSFGPRLLTEVLVAAFVITVVLLAEPALKARRRRWIMAGVALSIPAIAAHSGQALLNPASWTFNEHPVIKRETSEALFDWRTPQFLATATMLQQRDVSWQWRHLEPLAPKVTLLPGDSTAVFESFWRSEIDRRWTLGSAGRICFDPRDILRQQRYIVRVGLSVARAQRVNVHLDDVPVGEIELTPGPEHTFGMLVDGRRLDAPGTRCLSLVADAPHRAAADDPRQIAVSFHRLVIEEPPQRSRVDFTEERAFLTGWSVPEAGFRWSMARQPRLAIGTGSLPPDGEWTLILRCFGLGNQRLRVRTAEGRVLGDVVVSATRNLDYRLPLAATVSGTIELIFELPDARMPANGDTRLLGLALEEARIEPSPPR